MRNRNRQLVLMVLLTLTLALVCWWMYGRYTAAARRAATALADTHAAAVLATRIESLRRQPTLGNGAAAAEPQVAAVLQSAADEVGLSRNALASIRPQSPRRADGALGAWYEQARTDVLIEDAPLEAILRCLHALARRQPALRIESLQLSRVRAAADAAANTPSRWRLDPLTITYLIYAPRGGKP